MGDAEEGGRGGPGTKAIRRDMKSLLHPRTVLLVEGERQQEDIFCSSGCRRHHCAPPIPVAGPPTALKQPPSKWDNTRHRALVGTGHITRLLLLWRRHTVQACAKRKHWSRQQQPRKEHKGEGRQKDHLNFKRRSRGRLTSEKTA